MARSPYPHQTSPAFDTDEQPAFNVVMISHNHHDHMCCQTLKELAQTNPNTLYIVPAGDNKHMQRFGLSNVIEFQSWDDYALIELTDTQGNVSVYKIASIPANHASNRSINDFYESLYMGYMLHEVGKNEVVLCTGDTAIWDEEHFKNLQDYLLKHDLTLTLSAIAHGPDRPRSHMIITHQSTADAVAMFARFQCMNIAVLQKRQNGAEPSFELLKENSGYAVGYHQGCYRLGLLSLSDVDATLLRMLSVLESLKHCESLAFLVNDDGQPTELLSNNIHFVLLDNFEKQGLLDTLKVYKQVGFDMSPGKVKELICTYLTVPCPGDNTDLSLDKPHTGITYDYERLIQNRNPDFQHPEDTQQAYERLSTRIKPSYYIDKDFEKDPDSLKALIQHAFSVYIHMKPKNRISHMMNTFCEMLEQNNLTDILSIKTSLATFFRSNLSTQDEWIRDESDHHTLMVILAGLIDNLGNFREQCESTFQKGSQTLAKVQEP